MNMFFWQKFKNCVKSILTRMPGFRKLQFVERQLADLSRKCDMLSGQLEEADAARQVEYSRQQKLLIKHIELLFQLQDQASLNRSAEQNQFFARLFNDKLAECLQEFSRQRELLIKHIELLFQLQDQASLNRSAERNQFFARLFNDKLAKCLQEFSRQQKLLIKHIELLFQLQDQTSLNRGAEQNQFWTSLINDKFTECLQEFSRQQELLIKHIELLFQLQDQASLNRGAKQNQFWTGLINDKFTECLQQVETDKQILVRHADRHHTDLSSVIKLSEKSNFTNQILCRWQITDAVDSLLFPDSMPVTCLICGHTMPKHNYKTLISKCIFNGGRLERFICPECGAIFGPLKMLSLNQEQLAEEYEQNYKFFSEGDCTVLEKYAFTALSPRKDKTYLNFGAGGWNQTTRDLRAEGYNVFDYEPYAPVQNAPWILRSYDELSKFKFDGIFSNDLIEHLRNPEKDLKRMSGLLKPDGIMIHGSGCYEYAFEYTRFHLIFYTGKSLKVLGDKIGFECTVSDRTAPQSPFRIGIFRRKKRNF